VVGMGWAHWTAIKQELITFWQIVSGIREETPITHQFGIIYQTYMSD
jgi:hypothetical protein